MGSGIKVNVKFTDKDKGYRALLRQLSNASGPLSVGVHEDLGSKTHPNAEGHTVADVAAWNEFGQGNTPSRSWLRDWVTLNEKKVMALLKKNLGAIIKSPKSLPAKERLQILAEVVAKAMRDRITDRIPPPNAPRTLQQKQGDIPLIDTQTFIKSITGIFTPKRKGVKR